MKICVTGGAGFIGSHLVDAFLKEGHKVSVIDNLSTGTMENLHSVKNQIEFFHEDVGNEKLLLKVFQEVDMVCHQAALTSVTRSMADPLETHKQTMTSALIALDCARRAQVKRFIFAASSSAYGNQKGEYKVETMYPSPCSPYAAAKASFEMYAHAYAESFGLDVVGLRYFNVFGPRQDPDSEYAAVIPKFIQMMLKDQPPVITGDGNQSRDFTFVDNVVQANLLAAQATGFPAGKIINVACGKRTTLPELVDRLNQVAGTNFQPIYSDSRPGDVRHSSADITLAKQILNYSPLVSLETGLKKTWKYAKENWR